MLRTMSSHVPHPDSSPRRRDGRSRRPFALFSALCAVAIVAGACGSGAPAPGGSGAGGTIITPGGSGGGTAVAAGAMSGSRPNIVFVLTDDMRLDDLAYLPHVRELLGDGGMTFDQELDNVTLCCPARTAILRGQYSHNNGILTNGGTNGGFETAYATGIEADTVATALQDAGYRTGLFGKYLNGYPNTAPRDYIPPGWTTWSSSVQGNAYGEYSYVLNEDGKEVRYGTSAEDYGTDVYFQQAQDFASESGKAGQPFFAYISVYVPHSPATPAPRHQGLFPDAEAPRDPAFNEADVSDKPAYIRDAPLLSEARVDEIDQLYRKRLRSLQAVDEDVAALVDGLRATGQLDSTYVVFTSDNGFHLGQHRLPAGKQTAYETDIHLPLLIAGPGITPGSHTDALTGNIDLAPTFADWAGATLTSSPDGRSLVPLLDAGGVAPADWRRSFLLEHWVSSSEVDDEARVGEDGPQLEPADPDQGGNLRATAASISPVDVAGGTGSTGKVRAAPPTLIPEYAGLRTAQYTYVEYVTGERELYDLIADPDELTNLASTVDPALLTALHDRLDQLRTCAADTCRSIDARPIS